MVEEFKLIPLLNIVWKEPLRKYSDEEIRNMAQSFRIHSQLQPILVRPLENGLYEGVYGNQRYLASKHAKKLEILCVVRSLTDEEVLEARLVENLHRKELTAVERAEWYAKLLDLRKQTFSEESAIEGIAISIEEYTGEKPAARTVREYLEIASKLKKKAKEIATSSNNVGVRHALQVIKVEDEDKQAELLSQTIHGRWTTSKLKQAVDQELGVSKPKPEPINTGLNIACPMCQETYELIHIDEGKHRLRKVITGG